MINANYPAYFAATITLALFFDLVAQSFGALSFGFRWVSVRFFSAIRCGESRPRFIREIILRDSPSPCELINVIRVLFNTFVCILSSYVLLDGVARILNILSLLLAVTIVPALVGKILGTRSVKAVCYAVLLPYSLVLCVLYYPLNLGVRITKKCIISFGNAVCKLKNSKK